MPINEEEDEYVIKASMLSSESMVSAAVGRVMGTLLAARPKNLQDAISSLHSDSTQIAPLHVSLEQSLWFLHKYIKDASEKGYPLDDVLIPMIEHSLKIKESKHRNQAIILLNWLFQDELLFQALATDFAGILSRKHDHYVALGWCTLARCLIEYDIIIDKLLINGIREKHNALLKILSLCLTPLLSIVCSGSTLQGEFELPTRLAMAAADFILSHTVALAKIDPISHFSDKKPKSFQSTAPNMSAILASAAITDKKAKSTCKLSEQLDDTEMKFLLWEHLDEVIILVQRLINWSRKSRSLHVKGQERVLTWLEETKQHYMCFQNEVQD